LKKVVASAIITVIAASFLSVYFMSTGLVASDYAVESYMVTRIVDGDTVVLENGDVVRLLSIDTPERGKKCYKEASARLSDMILLKEVNIERDIEDKDRYKRSLRYIFQNGSFVNEELVREGYAYLYFVEPNTKYNTLLKEAAQEAKTKRSGCLWNQSA